MASVKLDKMTTAEIGKFLVACALAGDLYCPTCIFGATLAKDSKLAKQAAHYRAKVDGLLREVKNQFNKKPVNGNNGSKPQASAKSNVKGKGK